MCKSDQVYRQHYATNAVDKLQCTWDIPLRNENE